MTIEVVDKPTTKQTGFSCPACGQTETKITDSRKKKGKVTRRRVCLNCDFSFFTEEHCVFKNTYFYVINNNSKISRKPISSIISEVSEYIDNPSQALFAEALIKKWIFNQLALKSGEKAEYKRKIIYAIPINLLSEVYFVVLSKINMEIAQEYYARQIECNEGLTIRSLKKCNDIKEEIEKIEQTLNT